MALTIQKFDQSIVDEIIYNPIDFIGLTYKSAIAYLKLGFQETGFVAFGEQVLLAHLFLYVQQNGQKSLWSFKNYKATYAVQIAEALAEKQLSLAFAEYMSIDTSKVKIIGGFQSHTPKDREFSQGNIHMSSNYNDFYHLPFNRKVNERHVNELVTLKKLYGNLSVGVVIETDIIDGVMRKWIADGQHRFAADKKLGLPYYYTVAKVGCLEDIVLLVASLNTSSKKWPLKQYMETWASLKAPDYVTVKRAYERTKLNISLLLSLYSGVDRKVATKKFTQGKFSIPDLEKSHQSVVYMAEILKMKVLPRTRIYIDNLAAYMNAGMYNHDKFMLALQEEKVLFSFDEAVFKSQLKEICA